MPARLPRSCRQSGYPLLSTNDHGYCPKHAHRYKEVQRQQRGRDHRPSPSKRGYDRHWEKARRLFLMDNPLCVRCRDRGLIVSAAVVDHIEPHRGDRLKFWDRSNWQSLCKRCHDRKTATEDRRSDADAAWY